MTHINLCLKISFTAFLLFIAFHIDGQIPTNKNKTDKNGMRQGNWTITYDKNWGDTGITDSIAYYRIITYDDDKPQGNVTDYFISGQLQFEAKLLSDRPQELIDGKATWYYENGEVSKISNFSDGTLNGAEVIFYESGRKYADVFYKDGFAEGKVTYFTEDDEVLNIEFYEKGENLTIQTLWDKAIGYYNSGDYQNTEPLVSDIYIGFIYEFGPDDGNVPFLLDVLWKSQFETGKINEGVQNAIELCRVRELQKIPKDSVYRDWMYEMVVYFNNAERYDPVESLLLRILSIQKEISDDPNDYYLTYSRSLGDYYRFMDRIDEAEIIYKENIRILQEKFPGKPEFYNHDLAALGYLLTARMEYSKAEKLYLDAIASYRLKKDTSENFAIALSYIIDLYLPQAKNTEALPFAVELASLQKERKGKFSDDYANALYDLSQVYRETAHFPEAEAILIENEEIILKLYGQNSREYGTLMYFLGMHYKEAEDPVKAESYYLKTLETMKNNSDPDNESHTLKEAELLGMLGELYSDQEDVIKAQPVLNEAYHKIRNLANQNQFNIALIYEKIGSSQLKIRNYNEAEACYKEAIEITKDVYGETHHNYYQCVANLCVVYTSTNRGTLAINLLDDQLVKIEKERGRNNATYNAMLESKVLALRKLRQDSLEIVSRKEIAQFYKNKFGEEHLFYFNALGQLSMAQIATSRSDAEENTSKLEALASKMGIRKTDELYDMIFTLKWYLLNKKEDYAGAVVLAREMASIGESRGDLSGYIGLALSYFAYDQHTEALEAYQKYIDKVLKDVRQTFPYLTEDQKIGFYNSEIEYHLDLYYFFALAEPLDLKLRRDSAETSIKREEMKKIRYIIHPNIERIFNYQLITKGLLFEASQKMKQSILHSNDDELITLFNEWQLKKSQLNKTFQMTDSKDVEDMKDDLGVEIKMLERQMALKSSYFNQLESKIPTWKDVRSKLKEGEAFVEIMAISAGLKINPDKYKNSGEYLAFIISPKTHDFPLCVRLGNGDSLENKYLKNYQNCIRYKLTDQLSYDKYWEILADTLVGVNKVYFAPDGIYHKVNVNTLQNPVTGKYVLEEKEIQFVSQARDFVQMDMNDTRIPDDIFLFGAPNYNNLPGDKVEKKTSIPEIQFNSDSTQRFFRGSEINELPGTIMEVENIANLATSNNLSVQTYTGDMANETTLKQVQSPAILHIATHGFFMPELTISKEGISNERGKGFAYFSKEELKNPLRRSGLLFSYCRQAFIEKKNNFELPEDGILTADEAQNLSLDNTEMVVLSACETGLGEIKNGEGVYGLQRAFQTAGTKSVLMSLWTVSDAASQELMTEFYNQWFILQDKRKAFRVAQLNIKKKYTAPYYWGAFIMVGN